MVFRKSDLGLEKVVLVLKNKWSWSCNSVVTIQTVILTKSKPPTLLQ